MKIIDLSTELAHHMVRYPSPYLPEVTIVPAATHEVEARSAQIVTFGTHVSTHVDAPFHAIPGGKKIHELEPAIFVGPARVVRFPGRSSTSPIDAKDLEPLIDQLGDEERIIFDTGWAEKTWGTKEYFTNGTYLTRSAAQFLASLKKVRLLGMDFPNVDALSETKMGTPAPNHQILLGKGIVLLENLLRLSEVPDTFLLVAAPLKLVGGDGCPCRPLALIQ